MSRPRILLLCSQPFFQWRGSPIRVRYNIEALTQLGYTVDLVTLPFGKDPDIPHLNLHRVGSLSGVSDLSIGPSLAKLRFDFKIYSAAKKLLRAHTYAAVHGIEDAGFFAGVLARKNGLPFMYEKHSDPASYRKGWVRNFIMSVYSKVETYSLKRASAVIVTGAGLESRVKELAPHTPCAHIFDIPSSRKEPSEKETQQIRETLGLSAQDVVATYVGSFAVYQGIDLLFAAIPHALESSPRLQVVIIGGSAEEITERSTTLKNLGQAHRVHFVGKVDPDRLPAYLRASDLLLSPRISGHNTPLKVLDYFKAGRAIVATDMEANRLLLDDTTAAFAPCSAEEFAAVLSELAGDPQRREALAANGRGKIEQTYNFETYTRQLGEVYSRFSLPSTTP